MGAPLRPVVTAVTFSPSRPSLATASRMLDAGCWLVGGRTSAMLWAALGTADPRSEVDHGIVVVFSPPGAWRASRTGRDGGGGVGGGGRGRACRSAESQGPNPCQDGDVTWELVDQVVQASRHPGPDWPRSFLAVKRGGCHEPEPESWEGPSEIEIETPYGAHFLRSVFRRGIMMDRLRASESPILVREQASLTTDSYVLCTLESTEREGRGERQDLCTCIVQSGSRIDWPKTGSPLDGS